MVDFNLGSISLQILNRVENVPTTISGVTLDNIVDNQRVFVEAFTALAVGSIAIDEIFQPAIIDLAISETLQLMELQGIDASSIKLGDLSVSKGGTSAALSSALRFRESGMRKLAEISHSNRMFQAL